MSFQISALPHEAFAPLFALDDAQLRERGGARRATSPIVVPAPRDAGPTLRDSCVWCGLFPRLSLRAENSPSRANEPIQLICEGNNLRDLQGTRT
jgi:hypothetical protein